MLRTLAVGCVEYLVHAGVKAHINLICGDLLGNGLKGADANEGEASSVGQPLCDAATNTQPGECTWAVVVGNGVELIQLQVRRLQQLPDHGQGMLCMLLLSVAFEVVQVAIVQ